jgi:hypothetical protein
LIDRKLMQAIRKEDPTSKQNVYQKLACIARRFTVSDKVAALVLAEKLGIKISKYATVAELNEIRDAKAKTQGAYGPVQILRLQQKRTGRPYTLRFGSEFETDDPVLPVRIAEEAHAMAELYPYVYVFENSVRNIICLVMEKKYGRNWWRDHVGATVKKHVERNKGVERENAWHGKGKQHDVHYTELDDLRSIIASNLDAFKDITPPLNVLEGFFREIELSRNTIAHNNPLEKDDRERLKLNYRSWIRQVKASSKLAELRTAKL